LAVSGRPKPSWKLSKAAFATTSILRGHESALAPGGRTSRKVTGRRPDPTGPRPDPPTSRSPTATRGETP
jgi:hypothetical protein